MLIKRMLYTFRNKALTISQLILPLIFTAITIAIIKTLPDRDGIAPKLPINIDLYGKTTEFYSSGEQGELSGDVSDRFRSLFKSGGDQQLKLVDDPRDEIINTAKYSMKQYNTELIFAVDFGNSSASMKQTDAVVLFNGQPFHAAPAGLLYTDTAILKSLVNDCYSFAAANHPLPRTTRSEIEQAANGIFNANSFSYASSMMFGFSFLASSFVVFLITERSRKIKHSQTVSGVKWYNFWLSTLTWDYVNYLVPALLTVILFAIADIKNLSDVSNGNKQPLYLIILMLMYGFALLPNMYAIQYLFTGPATGYVAVTFFNILTGTTPQLVVTILSVIQSTKDTAKVLDWVFIVLLPNYNMGQGIANLYNNYEYIDLCYNKLPNVTGGKFTLDEICSKLKNTTNPCCKDHCGDSCLNFQEDFFAWESLGMGRSMTFLALQAVIYWTIIILIDTELITKLFYKMRPKVLVGHSPSEIQDEDVVSEREKILSSDANALIQDNEVVISGLSKYFGAKSAVDDVYLTIPQGECFGLLGVNGAGKTTTFKMLTGDETISGGTAYMNGNNIRTDIHEVQRSIGYCPQFDALIDQMTGEEMLYMYARLRGIPEEEIPTVVQNLISALLLDKHKKKLTRAYSGGNKRKLSTAIALMGDPPIIFLDEPTTGMDPVARRMLWQVLMKVRDSGKTLILTSHSMEECEALCTKLAIMVNGVYRCLGSTQHLKNKFGAGYSLIARVKYPADGSLPDIHSVERFVEENFPGSEIKDKHQNLIQYHIHKGELTWAVIFKKLEDNKERLGIEDYSVSQTTLEQVFINFARAQIPPDGAAGCPTRFRQMCCVCCTPEYVKASPLNV